MTEERGLDPGRKRHLDVSGAILKVQFTAQQPGRAINYLLLLWPAVFQKVEILQFLEHGVRRKMTRLLNHFVAGFYCGDVVGMETDSQKTEITTMGSR